MGNSFRGICDSKIKTHLRIYSGTGDRRQNCTLPDSEAYSTSKVFSAKKRRVGANYELVTNGLISEWLLTARKYSDALLIPAPCIEMVVSHGSGQVISRVHHTRAN